jgi:hypothetical protein
VTAKSLQHQVAAHTSWAKTPDRSARLANAWEARDARFEKQVDPDGLMAPEARKLAAASARKAFYAAMTLKSIQARQHKNQA